jgi:DNA-binding Lrp family transcriptional regulator
MEKLDLIDRKILYNLDKNSRQSASQVAKKLKIHRNVVNFRINRLVEKGIIRNFVTMINPLALGLRPYKIYLQLQNLTKEKENDLLKFIEKLPIYWSAKVSGEWDFIIGLLVKNIDELDEIKKEILNFLGEDIIRKSFSVLVEAPHYYRTYLSPKFSTSQVRLWTKTKFKGKLDVLDLKILKLMAPNSRISVTEIAPKVNSTVKTVMTRIRNLEKKGIIFDYRLSLNLDKIGYKFFKCFISLKNYNEQKIKEFFTYCQHNKNIIHVIETVGDWDLEPEIEAESNKEFYEIISEIRERFSNLIREIKTIDIIKEYSYVCVPTK